MASTRFFVNPTPREPSSERRHGRQPPATAQPRGAIPSSSPPIPLPFAVPPHLPPPRQARPERAMPPALGAPNGVWGRGWVPVLARSPPATPPAVLPRPPAIVRCHPLSHSAMGLAATSYTSFPAASLRLPAHPQAPLPIGLRQTQRLPGATTRARSLPPYAGLRRACDVAALAVLHPRTAAVAWPSS